MGSEVTEFELLVQICDPRGEPLWEGTAPDFVNANASQPLRVRVTRRPLLRAVVVVDQILAPWPPTPRQIEDRKAGR